MKRFLALVAIPLLWAAPLSSQLRGVVTEPSGAPVADVQVELWSAHARVGSTATDARGGFAVPAEVVRLAQRITLRRLGYAPLTAPLPSDSAALLRYVLHPEVLSLPELVVSDTRKLCPNREHPEARRLWDAARARYRQGAGDRGWSGRWRSVEEHVPARQIGIVDEARARSGSGFHYPMFRRTEERIQQLGYAFAMPWKDPRYRPWREFDAWEYPRLHSVSAHHFAADLFGERHTLSVVRRGPHETVLAFCGTRRDQPYLEGTLSVGPDTTFASAAWTFRTPRPNESAGGEVTFAPPPEGVDRDSPLAAARGVFWRRLAGRSLYFQEAVLFPDEAAQTAGTAEP